MSAEEESILAYKGIMLEEARALHSLVISLQEVNVRTIREADNCIWVEFTDGTVVEVEGETPAEIIVDAERLKVYALEYKG